MEVSGTVDFFFQQRTSGSAEEIPCPFAALGRQGGKKNPKHLCTTMIGLFSISKIAEQIFIVPPVVFIESVPEAAVAAIAFDTVRFPAGVFSVRMAFCVWRAT